MKKRIVCLTLAILMCGSQAVSVMADRESDLREEQAWTSQQLDATYARMSALWDQKQQLESQIESLNSDLVNVMVSIQTLESDIASKEAEIEKTQGDLTKAQNAKDKQYGAMKKRIQYLYEKGGNNAWFQMMLNADNLADLLTRAEYTQQMYEQDRESLQKYARTIEEVQKLEEQYEQEKADFETMKEEYEAQQSNLQYQLDVTRANSADCENEIAYAQQQATEYANLLEQQQAEIEQLEAERIAAEEEARRQGREILKVVGLTEKEKEYPSRMSGGQQQRVGIGRALATHPKVMLLDEPTSSLDPELVGEVLDVVRTLASKHITMLITTHEMDFARSVADRVLFLADGRIQEEGTPKQIFDFPKTERLKIFLSHYHS